MRPISGGSSAGSSAAVTTAFREGDFDLKSIATLCTEQTRTGGRNAHSSLSSAQCVQRRASCHLSPVPHSSAHPHTPGEHRMQTLHCECQMPGQRTRDLHAMRIGIRNAHEIGEHSDAARIAPRATMQCLDIGLLNSAALGMDDGQSALVHSVQPPISETHRNCVRNFDERPHSTGTDIDTADLFVVGHEHARAIVRRAEERVRPLKSADERAVGSVSAPVAAFTAIVNVCTLSVRTSATNSTTGLAGVIRPFKLAFAFAIRPKRLTERPIVRIRHGNVNELQSMIIEVADNQSVVINAHSHRQTELTGACAFGAHRSDERPIAFE
jgi:hypothetical protein